MKTKFIPEKDKFTQQVDRIGSGLGRYMTPELLRQEGVNRRGWEGLFPPPSHGSGTVSVNIRKSKVLQPLGFTSIVGVKISIRLRNVGY